MQAFAPFEFAFLKHPDHQPVFILPDRYITARQFISDIHHHYHKTHTLSCRYIALAIEDSYRFAVALFSCFFQHKIPVLLPNLAPTTLKAFRRDDQALLVDSDIEIGHSDSCSNLLPPWSLHQSQICLYSSGTTGKPTPHTRKLRHLITEIQCLEHTFQQPCHQTLHFYSSVSHQHIYGLLFMLLWPLYQGYIIHLPLLSTPEHFKQLPTNAQTVIISSPALLKRLAINPVKTPPKMIFSSGGLLTKIIAETIYRIFAIYPIEVLGSTETSGLAYRQQDQPQSSIWHCFDPVTISMDQTNERLCINSPFFSDDPTKYLLTNEKIRLIDQKRFEYLGRADRVVKIEEKRLSLDHLENQLQTHPFVHDCHTLVLNNKRDYVACVLVLSPDGSQYLQQHTPLKMNRLIQQYLRDFFDNIVIPKKFRYVDSIPVNSQGKIRQSDIHTLFN